MHANEVKNSGRKPIHMDWFINSQCDYACIRCKPPAGNELKKDIGLEQCLEALHSFVELGQKLDRDAMIAFYPRQAPFTDPFISILKATNEFKTKGLISSICCVNRGDLPDDKIRLFQESGVDVCQLTLDGPEPVQDFLRRQGSFRDTINAFRNARARGIHVRVLLITNPYNAPHLSKTLQLLLDEGFDDHILQMGVHPASNGYPLLSHAAKKESENPWNQHLTTDDYRSILAETLRFLDALPERHQKFRNRFILQNQMFARLFFETGREKEYSQLLDSGTSHQNRNVSFKFILRPNGDVMINADKPKFGSFPGASFFEIYNSSFLIKTLDNDPALSEYISANQRDFFKCRSCPVARNCPPSLIGASGTKLYYYPDPRCWVKTH